MAAVVGASGYTGVELVRLIDAHPHLELGPLVANTYVDRHLSEVAPNLAILNRTFTSFDKAHFDEVDVVFLALPHGESQKIISLIPEAVLVIDLGADFRLARQTDWENYYGGDYAGNWTYGLADSKDFQAEIKNSSRVANPGCYATAIQLSLLPFLEQNLINLTDVRVVATSGTSGAGRKAVTNLISSENMNNMQAYKVGGVHQHTPEIEQTLRRISNSEPSLSFTPILAPMPRGIISVTTAKLNSEVDNDLLRQTFIDYYDLNPFTVLLTNGSQPSTKAVQFSNSAHFQIEIDRKHNLIIVTAAIDNLIKGAAGQAIQNFNIMSGLEMSTGLSKYGMYP